MPRTFGAAVLAANLIMIINFGNRLSPPKIGGAGSFACLRWYEIPRLANASTTTTTTQRWQDFALGKVVKVGATNYIKVADDQWLAVAKYPCVDPVLLTTGASKSFSYTGSPQEYTFYPGCEYRVELWGASSNTYTKGQYASPGYGGYVSGDLNLNTPAILYVYVGAQGQGTLSRQTTYEFNGGGYGWVDTNMNPSYGSGSGGGATDIRMSSGSWDDADSLRSRLIVAGAGGGMGNYNAQNPYYVKDGHSGGLQGINGDSHDGRSVGGGGTQVSGGLGGSHLRQNPNLNGYFGMGGKCTEWNCSGGGGGWYGGGGATHWSGHGGGGSSYISGHTGCVAVTSTSDSTPKSGCTTGTTNNSCSISPYGYTFTDTVMIDGAGYAWTNVKGALQPMPNPAGGYYASGVGHTGNGAARITRLN